MTPFRFDGLGPRVPRLIIGEVGVSGNSFIDNVEKRLWLSSSFHALVTDMESASVAQVSPVNGIPFIIFRSALGFGRRLRFGISRPADESVFQSRRLQFG